MGQGRGDVGLWDVELGDARTWDSGTRGHRDLWTLGDSRTWDVWTRGRDKQTAPEFCAGLFYNLQFLVVKRKVLYAGEFVSKPVADDCKHP